MECRGTSAGSVVGKEFAHTIEYGGIMPNVVVQVYVATVSGKRAAKNVMVVIYAYTAG
jgi:hypothetical protein